MRDPTGERRMIRTDRLWVQVQTETIAVQAVLDFVTAANCGAVNCFIGTVRDHIDGRTVSSMEYEGYAEMAEREMERICRLAGDRWAIHRLCVHHRLGHLQLTEASIVVAVSAPHRRDVFETAQFIMDAVKKDVPIWKREHFADGQVQWQNEPPAGG